MPLLRKQPFHKVKPPSNLDPEEEVFLCKITNEIFRDYEEFFERIILCNSLVWSCAITGRSGMTYQEAEDCEEKARRQLATFPESLQRPLLFLATKTYRGRLVDLNDDIFLFAKDRYFIGETVDVLIAGERRPSKIIKVVAPAENVSKSNGDVIVIDEDSDSDEDGKKELPASEKMMYIVHPSTGKNNRVMVKASQVTRKKGLYTRDKSKLFLKQHCEPVNGVWSVKEVVMRKLHLTESRYEDFYSGPKPNFGRSDIKKKNIGKKLPENAFSPVLAPVTTPVITPVSTPSACVAQKSKSCTPSSTATSKSNSPIENTSSPQTTPTLTPAERAALKEKERLEKIAERMAKQEEMKRKIEEEKQRKKEEREREREKKKEEKKKEMEKLKEWSRPREDTECDDLKPLPEFKKLNCRVPGDLFGDAVMVLEYLSAFKSVFDFKQFFPKGLNWSIIESALVDCDPQGPLCDLLQMLLCALFNLQEEEAEEYMELEKKEEEEEEAEKAKPAGEEEPQAEEEDHVSNNELIRSATSYAQYSQVTFGMPLRDTLLDQFTLTEVMRLHLMSSGARANSKNARFRYQQRGGYSSLDDPGVELRKQDPQLLKKLQTGNVFDFSPDEKLRLLTTLVQQVMTYAAVRDIVEESYDKLRVKKYDFKLLQWAEVRRIREDQVAHYRRQLEEKNKEREHRLKEYARNEQIKQAQEQGLELPNLPSLDASLETAEERQKREEKEQQEERKKRADYVRRELEALQHITELQRTNALYPMGRDRYYRRYWLFSSLPAVAVEDHELFLDPSAPPAGECGVKDDGDKTTMPTLVKQEEHNASSDKENELGADGCTKSSDVQVKISERKGRDDECFVISDDDSLSRERKKSVDAETGEDRPLPNGASDAEKEVSVTMDQSDNGLMQSVVTEHGDKGVCVKMEAQDSTLASESSDLPPSAQPPKLENLPMETEQCVPQSPGEKQAPAWYIMHSRDCVKELLEALNPRGFREISLSTVLTDFKPLLEVTIDACPVELLCGPSEGEEGAAARAQTRTSAPRIVEGSTKSDSASEAIELTLRAALLDLEDRIFVGSLGAIKVKDRALWRACLESGGYSAQTDEAPFSQVQTPQKDGRTDADGSVHVPEELVARDLAHAMVQIARGVEPRFMTHPLGDDDKRKGAKEETPDKDVRRRSTYERWEESALLCSSLSQVFLHLAALDKSIKWDRSARLAGCRICRRKGDAEKMLLCDKCDQGHHMYCLKPPMTKVPSGDWFCPNCRPKQPAPSPRKSRRRTFSEVEEDEEEEEDLELEETISETNEEEQETEEEAMEEEEEEEAEDSDSEEEVENEDVCAECREDGKLILCDVCPRSYHMQCAKPPLKKVPKGKWMCQVCVGGGRAGKILFSRPTKPSVVKAKETPTASKKETPRAQGSASGSSKGGKSGSRPGSRRETPRNSPTPTSSRAPGKKDGSALRDTTPKGTGQKVTPKGLRDKDTPRSAEQGKIKRSSSSSSRLSADGGAEFEITARQYTSSKRGNSVVQQMKACEDLLQELIKHEDAWPFLKPVDKKLVPDYYDVIHTPMDLSTIRNKVHKFQYSAPSHLLDDVRLIFSNCVEYNARNTPEYRAGQGLSKFFQMRVKELGLREDADYPSAALTVKKQRR